MPASLDRRARARGRASSRRVYGAARAAAVRFPDGALEKRLFLPWTRPRLELVATRGHTPLHRGLRRVAAPLRVDEASDIFAPAASLTRPKARSTTCRARLSRRSVIFIRLWALCFSCGPELLCRCARALGDLDPYDAPEGFVPPDPVLPGRRGAAQVAHLGVGHGPAPAPRCSAARRPTYRRRPRGTVLELGAAICLIDRDGERARVQGVASASTCAPRRARRPSATHTRLVGATARHGDGAREDPRLATHPLVTGAPHIRFYAGEPSCGSRRTCRASGG